MDPVRAKNYETAINEAVQGNQEQSENKIQKLFQGLVEENANYETLFKLSDKITDPHLRDVALGQICCGLLFRERIVESNYLAKGIQDHQIRREVLTELAIKKVQSNEIDAALNLV